MDKPIPRRVFLMTAAACGAALATAAQAATAAAVSTAAATNMVDEKNAQATALGYVADAKNVDVKKFPKYAQGQVCSNCVLYQGKATDKAGGCLLFSGKQVAGPGWCSTYAKKA